MNHRILAASVSALIAAARISSAQEPTNVEPTDKPVKKHLKIVTDHVNPANTDQTIKIESGAISVEGGSKGTLGSILMNPQGGTARRTS